MAINTLKLLKEIHENGKAECPLCNSGHFAARSDIPAGKQTQFICSHCKEKLIVRIKMPNRP